MGTRLEQWYLRAVQAAEKSWLVALCLLPLAMVSVLFWGAIVLRRALLLRKARSRTLSTPVVSIGNITVGGTGKTPCIALLLRHLSGTVGLATRGYRRTARGLYVAKGAHCSADAVGDEAAMIGRRFPRVTVAACERKWDAVQALDEPCDVILLDDGLQRYDIPQQLQIATIDCTCPDGYGWLLPRGLLREPFSRLQEADYFVITNADASLPALKASLQPFRRPIIVTKPVIQRFFSPDGSDYALGPGQRVALISGIAHPEQFRWTMERMGFHVVDHCIVQDHGEIADARLHHFADTVHAAFPDACLVGTEKDWARRSHWPEISICFSEMDLHIIEGSEVFAALLRRITAIESTLHTGSGTSHVRRGSLRNAYGSIR